MNVEQMIFFVSIKYQVNIFNLKFINHHRSPCIEIIIKLFKKKEMSLVVLSNVFSTHIGYPESDNCDDDIDYKCSCPYDTGYFDSKPELFYCKAYLSCLFCKQNAICAYADEYIVFHYAKTPTFECKVCKIKYFPCLCCGTFDKNKNEYTTVLCKIDEHSSYSVKLEDFITEDGYMKQTNDIFHFDGNEFESDGPDGGLGTTFSCKRCDSGHCVSDK